MPGIMWLFLILIGAYFVGMGYFVQQNGQKLDVHMFMWTWAAIPAWLPVVSAGVVMFVLMFLWVMYGRARLGFRHWTLGRRISEHDSTIADLRQENNRLRTDVARLSGRQEGVAGQV